MTSNRKSIALIAIALLIMSALAWVLRDQGGTPPALAGSQPVASGDDEDIEKQHGHVASAELQTDDANRDPKFTAKGASAAPSHQAPSETLDASSGALRITVRSQSGEPPWAESAFVDRFRLQPHKDDPTRIVSEHIDVDIVAEDGSATLPALALGDYVVCVRSAWSRWHTIPADPAELSEWLAKHPNCARYTQREGETPQPLNLVAHLPARLRITFAHDISYVDVDARGNPGVQNFRHSASFQLSYDSSNGREYCYTTWEGELACDLTIKAKGFAPWNTKLPLLPLGSTYELGPLTLTPGLSFFGKIVDSAGNPLEGVKVLRKSHASIEEWGAGRSLYETEALVRSDAEGCFAIHDLSATPPEHVLYQHRWELVALHIQEGSSVSNPQVITMRRYAKVQGVLTGQPTTRYASTFNVALIHASKAESVDLVSADLVDSVRYGAHTNADGSFSFDAVEPGSYYPIAFHIRGGLSKLDRITLRYDEERTLSLIWQDSAEVSGRVTREDGIPVAGMPVALWDTKSISWAHRADEALVVTTDAGGNYRFTDVLAGKWYLHLRCDPQSSSASIDESRALQVERDDLERDIVVESAGVTVSGRILVNGKAQMAEKVHFHPVGGRNAFTSDYVESGYSIDHVAPGTYDVWVDYLVIPGWSSTTVVQRVTIPEGVSAFTCDLIFQTSDLSVQVVGAPVGTRFDQLYIAVHCLEGAVDDEGSSDQRYVASMDLSDSGLARVGGLLHGRYKVTIRSQHGTEGPDIYGWRVIDFDASTGTIQLDFPAETGGVRFTLQSIAGLKGSWKPAMELTYFDFTQLDSEGNVLADDFFESGWFREVGQSMTINDLPPGHYRVECSAHQFSYQMLTLTIRSGEITERDLHFTMGFALRIELEGAGLDRFEIGEVRYTLTMYDDAGQPVGSSLTQTRWDRLDFSIEGLHPSDWSVRVEADGYQPVELRLTSMPGEHMKLSAHLVAK